MLVLLPWLWNDRDRVALPRWLLIAWAGWAISQVATDLVVDSQFADLSRGWAKIAFTLSNVLAIAVLASTESRARLFGLGFAVGGVVGTFIDPTPLQAADPWKFGVAGALGLALAAGLSDPRLARRAWVAPAAFAAFGALNIAFGFRSLGAIAVVVSVFLLTDAWWARRERGARSVQRAVVLAVLLVATAGAIFAGYTVAASQGLLGKEAQAKYVSQLGAFGLLLGGRTEILGSSQAIMDSPILGHGSWAKDPRYGILMNERLEDLGYAPVPVAEDGLIPTHSYLFQGWVEAGVLGAVFWLATAILAVRALLRLLGARLSLAPLAAYSTFLLLWSIPFSPYSNAERISASFTIVLCLLVLRVAATGEPERHALPHSQVHLVP
jgi:O-antigen ligase